MPFADRLRNAFRDAPWCSAIATTALVVWLLAFFGVETPMQLLGGALDVPHAWRWITYPLANVMPPSAFLWFAVGLVFFVIFLSELEVRWGSLRFLRIFLVFTLVAAAAEWCAFAVAMKGAPLGSALTPQMWGMKVPAAALFMVWCAFNQGATIMFMFVLPIQARYLAILDVVLMFFDDRGPIFGLADATVLCLAWYWATRFELRSVGQPPAPGRSLGQWWSDRKKAKRKGRFQVLEGGTPSAVPSRVGSLKSMSKTPAPKDPEPAEKELNRILDKIRFEGMSSLTEAERATLDSQSRRLRGDA